MCPKKLNPFPIGFGLRKRLQRLGGQNFFHKLSVFITYFSAVDLGDGRFRKNE
jgi:hypothetical protein